jgi:hypothetical protein
MGVAQAGKSLFLGISAYSDQTITKLLKFHREKFHFYDSTRTEHAQDEMYDSIQMKSVSARVFFFFCFLK